MIFLNEYEVENYLHMFDPQEQPNLDYCARALAALMDWTNSESDGWPYWQKPLKASARLSALLHDHRYVEEDVTVAEAKRAMTPVKAFLTRHGADWMAVIPKEVWL